MSDEESVADDSGQPQMLHAQYKDGQLQIVEVTPFNREQAEHSILPDIITTDSDQQKYMQVLNIGSGSNNKGLMQLDLLNLTLVRCEDGEESYRLVTNSEDGSELPADATVALLQSSDEDPDNNDYVMVEGSEGLVFLQAQPSPEETQLEEEEAKSVMMCEVELPPAQPPRPPEKKKKLTPQEVIEKAKAFQRAKAILSSQIVRPGKRGRRRKGDLPPPHELLASPNFKLYLYSCKMCAFKCNAVKELQAHRASTHGSGGAKPRGSISGPTALQCARCPHKAASHLLLVKHVQTAHLTPEAVSESITYTNKVSLNSKEVEEADVLVCGACGYESSDRDAFRAHIETEHGATTT